MEQIIIDLSPEIKAKLDAISSSLDAKPNYTKIVSWALAVFEFCVFQEAQGNKIVLQFPDASLQDVDIVPKKV